MTAGSSTTSQEGRLVRNCRAARTGAAAAAAACWSSCGYGGGEDEGGGIVAGKTWDLLLLRVLLHTVGGSHTKLRVSRTAAGVCQYSIAT